MKYHYKLPFPPAHLGEVLITCAYVCLGVGMCTGEYRRPRSPEEDVGTRELLKFLEDVENLTWVLGTPVLRKNSKHSELLHHLSRQSFSPLSNRIFH